MHGYERAHDQQKKNIAEAYFLRAQAHKKVSGRATSGEQARAFSAAARAFWKSGEEAALRKQQRVYFRICAECYLRADEAVEAAVAYERAGEFTLSAKYFRFTKRFDDAVRVVNCYRTSIDDETAANIVDVAKLFYVNEGSIE